MRPIRFYWTPYRQLAVRRLCYHLVAMYAGFLGAALPMHQSDAPGAILCFAWAMFRIPAAAYVIGFIQIAAKTAEDGSGKNETG